MPELAASLFRSWNTPRTTTEKRLLSASATIMLLELICIRWVPAYLTLFGFFTNFVLLGALLGIGAGLLCGPQRKLPSFALMLFGLVYFVMAARDGFGPSTTQILFYGAEGRHASALGFLILPAVFGLVAAVFLPLGQILAEGFDALPPMRAYVLDIAGSLSGIAIFTLLSWLSTPPVVWIAILVPLAYPIVSRPQRLVTAVSLLAIGVLTIYTTAGDTWSPYYLIHYQKEKDKPDYDIWVNNIPHQRTDRIVDRPTFCFVPYDTVGQPPFRNALIIGAGTGSDIAVALSRGVQHVDAVEIDPDIYRLGKRLHPEHPYDDPRVTVHINDGRAFMRNTDQHFDLIIFALTDSLVLSSSYANLRLESFLFTEEAFLSARKHLTPDGILVVYNFYREDWSIHRLAGMLDRTFGEAPFAVTFGNWGQAAVLLDGPRLSNLPAGLDHPFIAGAAYHSATKGFELPVTGAGRLSGYASEAGVVDDWPFFYLQHRLIPNVYLLGLGMVALIALTVVRWAAPLRQARIAYAEFFLLGAAFMALEARSLVVFSLLFGTTWLVNALVFFAILSGVLLAIAARNYWRPKRLWLPYLWLLALLVANYAVPLDLLLGIDVAGVRYIVATAFVFAPIFMANVIFAETFASSNTARSAFAWNLLGIMAGGIIEYGALIVGYRNLVLIVALLYSAALCVRVGRSQHQAAQGAAYTKSR